MKGIFKTFKEFSDNCDIIFTPNQLIIKSMAPGHDAYLYTVIPKEDCLEYYSEEFLSFEIDLDIINKVLARLGTNDNLIITSHDEDQILMILKQYNKERKFFIAYKETEESPAQMEKALKDLNTHAEKGVHFIVSIEEFSTVIKDAQITTDTVHIFYENSHIRFSNNPEEKHNYEYVLDNELDLEELENPFIAKYDLLKFERYCKNTINSQFFCSIASNGPAILTQKFFHNSEFMIFIAPRVDEEEEEEEIESDEEHVIEEEA